VIEVYNQCRISIELAGQLAGSLDRDTCVGKAAWLLLSELEEMLEALERDPAEGDT